MRPPVAILILVTIIICGFAACGNESAPAPLTFSPASTISPTPQASLPPTATIKETPTPEVSTTTAETSLTPITPETSPTPTDVTETPTNQSFKVVGYITHWHFSRLSGFNLEGLTHLIWQGIEVTSGQNAELRVANNDDWNQITEVVKIGHSQDIKVLASLIGRWNESNLNKIIQSAEQRKKLVVNLKDLVETYELDGIDIDNENMAPDKEKFSAFIKELYDTLEPMGKIITLAGNPFDVRINPDVFSCLDFINLMTYDMGNGVGYPYHSTLEESIQAMNYWAENRMPREKLLMGIPLYGRDGGTTFYEYRWIVEKYNPTPDQNEVSEPMAAGGIIWWNGIDLVKEKVLYAKDNDFGGVMLYEIGTDSQGKNSLLEDVFQTISEPLNTGTTVQNESGQRGE